MNWSELNKTLTDGAGKAQRDQDISLPSLLASLAVSGTALVIATAVFVSLKNRFPRIYQPSWSSQSSIPPLPSGPLQWLLPIVKLSDETIIRERGLDAFLLLRFLRTAVLIFVPLASILVPVLVSLDVTATSNPISGATGLSRLSWSNLQPGQQGRYWGNCGACVCVATYVSLIIRRESQLLARLRHSQLLQRHRRSAGSFVLVTRIPKDWLSDDSLESHLRRHYARFCRDDTVVQVVRDWHSVINQITRRNELVEALETTAIRRSQKNIQISMAPKRGISSRVQCGLKPQGWRQRPLPTTEVLATAKKIQRMNEEIDDAVKNPTRFPLRPCAFLRFSDPVSAHILCRVAGRRACRGPVAHRIDTTDGNQIVWENMDRQWRQQQWSRAAAVALKVLLAAGWAIPISLTGVLSQLSDLATVFPVFNGLIRMPSQLRSVLQGVLPQLALTLLMDGFPCVLTRLVAQQAHPTRAAAELSLQSCYFVFLYLQVFVVVSVSSAITVVIPALVDDPTSVTTILAENLPKASSYFVSYVLLFAFSRSAAQLTRVTEWIRRVPWPWIHRSPRARWTMDSTPPALHLGLLLPVLTNLLCLGIIFSVMAPVILAGAALTFLLFWGVYRYLIIYVVAVPIDSCGLLYGRALQQLMVGVYTLELCQIGLFALAGARGPLACMVITMGATGVGHYRTGSQMCPEVTYLPIDLEIEKDGMTSAVDTAVDTGLGDPCVSESCPVVWIPEGTVSQLITPYTAVSGEGLVQNADGTIWYRHGPPDTRV